MMKTTEELAATLHMILARLESMGGQGHVDRSSYEEWEAIRAALSSALGYAVRMRSSRGGLRVGACKCGRQDVLLMPMFRSGDRRLTYHDRPDGIACEHGGQQALCACGGFYQEGAYVHAERCEQ